MKNLICLLNLLLFSYITLNHCEVYIVTRLYCDSKEEESLYPNNNSYNKSSSDEFQKIYWQCACVMFASSKKFNPNAKHILFTNKDTIPLQFDLLLKAIGVEIINIPMTYQTPKDFYAHFRNSFYMLDVINYLSLNCNQNDKIIILDSDCIWTKSANLILKDIEKYKLLNYDLGYSPHYSIGTLTRIDYQTIYQDILNQKIDTFPKHFGAEIIACDYETLNNISREINPVWKNMLYRFKTNKKKFVTEEHVLSFIYFKLNLTQGYAKKYIKRIWTSHLFNNVSGNEANFTIWHLPTEKNTGFVNLFNSLINPASEFMKLKTKEFAQFCAKSCSIII
ncbi:MAG: hypothetical protein P4L22_06190 [Candidatus Babeliales bacterium]|nr:hypothetical protein [Candidatus Babeliales bacterium]